MSATAAVLLATAFAAGVTGAWSPCGFSMVETLGTARERAGAAALRAGCAAFALGALAGGAITFTALAALGAALGGAGGTAALVAAVAIALAAALGEALGVRIVPQIRRQVPEPWRRTLPLPLAAGLYGVLLGLGFTTFVLTLAVWALAGIAVAIGDPLAGLLIGVGFGAGRALPVVAMAPRYATLGQRLELAMAERPALLRRLRLADGALLALLALAFLATGSASAARPALVAADATDPAAAGGALAWQRLATAGGGAVLAAGETRSELAGAQSVALGGGVLAARVGETVIVRDRASGRPLLEQPLPGATALAVSGRWLAWRTTRPGGGDRLLVAALRPAPGGPPGALALGPPRVVAGVGDREAIDRPALAGDHLAYAASARGASGVVIANLRTRERRSVLRTRHAQLSQPALEGGRLLYVQSSRCTQRLRLVRTDRLRRPRTLLRIGATAHRDPGHEHDFATQGSEPGRCPHGTPRRTDTLLWTTALAGRAAYVTLLRPGAAGGSPATARIVRVRG